MAQQTKPQISVTREGAGESAAGPSCSSQSEPSLPLGPARLSEYLRTRGLGGADLGRALGVSRTAVHNWIHRKSQPSEANRAEIERVTRGGVRREDWCTVDQIALASERSAWLVRASRTRRRHVTPSDAVQVTADAMSSKASEAST